MTAGIALFLILLGTAKSAKNNLLAESIQEFGFEIYDQLAKSEGNVLFSPLSAHGVLSLLYLGTGGRTEEGLAAKLKLNGKMNTGRSYKSLLSISNNLRQGNIKIKNNFFASKDVVFRRNFKSKARQFFDAQIENVNFANPEVGLKTINNWINRSTNSKIRTLTSGQKFNTTLNSILASGFHFKGLWANKFDRTLKGYNFEAPFGVRKCDMMEIELGSLLYANYQGIKILELPYSNVPISMIFVLPSESSKFDKPNVFKDAIKNVKVAERVHVMIPKFKFETELELKNVLESMGFDGLFNAPDFSELHEGGSNVTLSKVILKSLIEINEDGVDTVTLRKSSRSGKSRRTTFQFIADRPFLIFLYDRDTKTILVQGRIENPSK